MNIPTEQLVWLICGALWPSLIIIGAVIGFYIRYRSGTVDYIVQMNTALINMQHEIKEKIDDRQEEYESLKANVSHIKMRIGLEVDQSRGF